MLPILFSILLRWDWSVLAQSTTFSGGLALRFPGACPSDLISEGVTFESNCCAANQTFVKDEEDSVCCPDVQHKTSRKIPLLAELRPFIENDCYSEVEKAARVSEREVNVLSANF